MKNLLFELSKRSRKGQNQAEFAAAFTVLVVIVMIPLINLAAIPIRAGLASALVKDTVKELSLSERFSDAVKSVKDDKLSRRLAAIGGVELTSVALALRISKVSDDAQEILVEKPGAVPANWLPDGANSPTNVQLILTVEANISPLLLGANLPGKIPGLTVPFAAKLPANAGWENLGRDPQTGEFYLNE